MGDDGEGTAATILLNDLNIFTHLLHVSVEENKEDCYEHLSEDIDQFVCQKEQLVLSVLLYYLICGPILATIQAIVLDDGPSSVANNYQ